MAGLVLCWLGLIVLSVGTLVAGASGFWWGVLLLAVAKAWVIVDGFMELRRARWVWRGLVLGWAFVVMGLSTYPLLR
ncbi:hypothetical protein BFW88_15915 [Pseudomonas fluorescens]|uniref:Cytochrome C oxidase subunit IV family protein n=1 Tax=Pseudomonas lactucae TaxID=2813360 RepID=A0A9X0YE41_9PSED|nr:cytochrome C oxidase subunit IV family protein [Pseudomonas lactucae]OPA89092.1 hypothetical protein BFW88_15915 [Pseudomonas fluorescens]MBN2978498.1 cytochrome C oxidase subunit IV family protein [Pseudomonas lactucae]MBN2985533.1 cytochrome C oxidase subunit IV family protein [Pseudomonas lactucae]OPB08659.1 hypothetical protein BFW92_15845 [Pseudomonas fluorescens]OPB19613.1 hypothetical protein BFW93_15875 [Pseudomonas fluorescens]